MICLALAAMTVTAIDRLDETRTNAAFGSLVEDSEHALDHRIAGYEGAVDAAAGLLTASDDVTARDWRRFVTTLDTQRHYPGLRGIGLIVPVRDGQQLSELPAEGTGFRYVVRYFARRGGEEVRGRAVPEEDPLLDTARAAYETGRIQLTPLLEQGLYGSHLLIEPVFGDAAPGSEPPLLGLAFAGFEDGEALAGLTPSQGAMLGLSVTDTSGARPKPLYSDPGVASSDDGSSRRLVRDVPLYGRTWQVQWQTTEAFDEAQAGKGPWVVLAAALAISALAILLVRKIASQQSAVAREVAHKTRELRARMEQNRSIIDNSVLGILLLDAEDRVLEANAAACRLFGLGEKEITGLNFRDLALEGEAGSTGEEVALVTRQKAGSPLRLMCQRNDWTTEAGEQRSTLLIRDVTEEHEAAERLREAERRWNMALAGAQIGVFDIDILAGTSRVSDTWKQIMGLDPSAEVEHPQKTFFDLVHPDDRDIVLANDRACIRGETSRSVSEYRVRFPDGSWRWMRSNAVVAERTDTGYAIRLVGAQSDVTDIRRAQEALLASEERFRLAVAHAPVGTAIVDAYGRFESVNEALRHFSGHGEAELLDSHIATLLDDAERATLPMSEGYLDVWALLQRTDGEKFQDEVKLRHKDGTTIWGLVSIASTHDLRRQRSLFIVQVHDITQSKEMDQMKSQFVATVSHELRTPLTSIKGALGIITGSMADKLPRQSLRLLEIAKTNSDRLVLLVNDILDMEKISSGQMDFLYEAEDAAEILNSAVASMRPFAAELEVHLSLDLPDETCCIWVDRSRTEQVLANLLSNACKFSDPGGRVVAGLLIEEDRVLFSVSDEGPGVPDSFRAKLFDPFSQADSSDTREKGGTGLGLSIARRIVERMGGEIGLDDNTTRGSVFWFTCPRVAEELPAEEPSDAR